jgi:hypothetical protein
MREVFEFAVYKTICFFNGWSRYAFGYSTTGDIIKEKFWGICFTPLGVGIEVGGDGGFEPMFERTVVPFVLWGLQTDESGAEAEGVGEVKG